MSNKFGLSCRYCGFYWEVNYNPSDKIYCLKCRDSHVKVINISTDKVDYYIGCPPFEKKIEEDPDKWYIG
jgi:hypothetical protein